MKFYGVLAVLMLNAVAFLDAADGKPWLGYVAYGEGECDHETEKEPMVVLCRTINKALIQSEVVLYDSAALQARITAQFAQFQEQESRRCTEVMRYFNYDIERTFHEHSQEPLARLVLDAVAKYEKERGWGWSLMYRWKANPDGTRSLWCVGQADPRDLEAAKNEKQAF